MASEYIGLAMECMLHAIHSSFRLVVSFACAKSSSVGEFHPHALTDPYMSLSADTAPIDQPQLHGLALPNGSSHCWVGTGNNAAITPEQVQEVMGSDVIRQLAERSGVSFDAAKAQLAELLPSLIDKVTPEGKIPEEGLEKGQEQ